MASITTLLSHPEVWLALLLTALGLVLLAWRLRLAWRPAWLLRFLLISLTLLALFAPFWQTFTPHPAPQRQVMVVDQSDSLTAETRQQALEQAVTWQAAGPQAGAPPAGVPNTGSPDPAETRNRSIVIFGSQAVPVLPKVSAEAGAADFTGAPDSATVPQVDGRASNVSEALKLAENLLGSQPGQILLVSDGLAAQPTEVSAVANELARRGHTLDVISLAPRPMESDLALGSLIAPKNLWAGTPVDLQVSLLGAGSGPRPQLKLRINGQDSPISAEMDTTPQPAGSAPAASLFHFQIPSLPEGMVTLEVSVSAGDAALVDPFPANNAAYTTLQVFAPPRVLFVTSRADTDPVTRFTQALGQKQIQPDILPPEKLTTNLEALQQYRVIFLDDLLSNQLNREQMTALQLFASKLAGGLVFLGGRNSYTLGGYEGTPLEAMLPVKLQPPPRTQRPPMVFQLILDHSASMGIGDIRENLEPMDLARESAMRAIETLQAQDYLGVLAFSDDFDWVVPLRPLGGPEGLQRALDAVSRVGADGTTNMLKAMEETLKQVSALPADAPPNRHILLLSDGQSTDGRAEEFPALAKAARDRGITISTIALGDGADEQVMKQIAEAGNGRYYFVEAAGNLPKILVAESKAARSENIQPGETSLKAVEAGHPILSGMGSNPLPLLRGYNALQSRAEEGAEDILVSSSFGDPILSAWQYGLGRVAAWTGDLGEEWTAGWPPESEGAFWAQVVRYMLVDPAQSPAQASVQVEPTRLLVEGSIYNPNGEPVNLAEVKFTYADPAGKTTTYQLIQKSAGIYQAEIPRPPDGAYRAVLSYPGADGKTIEVPAPFAINPPQEWLPQIPATGQANLQTWASATGGQVTTLQGISETETPPAPKPPSFLEDFWGRLLLALVILWPLEIAIRRRWLPWMD